MTQAGRLESLEAFRTGTAAYLLATDVAARGLDIQGVQVRVGRTIHMLRLLLISTKGLVMAGSNAEMRQAVCSCYVTPICMLTITPAP
jgi:hypothetical protein